MTSDDGAPRPHVGADHSAPYPIQRLAPPFQASDLAAELATELTRAEALLTARTGAKLRVIADQIRALQAEARKILDEAREEQALSQAECHFRRRPGHIYHLYRRADRGPYFSMLAPDDWGGQPPHAFIGSYRLEPDYSWTPLDRLDAGDDTGDMIRQLLRIGGLATGD